MSKGKINPNLAALEETIQEIEESVDALQSNEEIGDIIDLDQTIKIDQLYKANMVLQSKIDAIFGYISVQEERQDNLVSFLESILGNKQAEIMISKQDMSNVANSISNYGSHTRRMEDFYKFRNILNIKK